MTPGAHEVRPGEIELILLRRTLKVVEGAVG